jgi:hypothetical protein
MRRYGQTAVMIAARNGDRAIVAALLDPRADVNTKDNDGCAFAAARPARGRRRPTVRRCSHARPIRQVDSAALCGVPRFRQRRRGAARRRRRSAHHGHPRVDAAPPTSHADGRTPLGAGERLANSHNNTTYSASTTWRWRRRGRRTRALLPHCVHLTASARHAGAARHAEAALCGVRRRARGMFCAAHAACNLLLPSIGRMPCAYVPLCRGGGGVRGAYGHVARGALRAWPRVRSDVSRAWRGRPSSSFTRRPRCVRSARPVLESTIRRYVAAGLVLMEYSRVRSAHSAQSRRWSVCRRRRRRVENRGFGFCRGPTLRVRCRMAHVTHRMRLHGFRCLSRVGTLSAARRGCS